MTTWNTRGEHEHQQSRPGRQRDAERRSARRQPARQVVEAALGDQERGAARDAHDAERGDERRQPGAARRAPPPARRWRRRSPGPPRTPRRSGQPSTVNRWPVITEASAITAPGARSMPPAPMIIAAPIARDAVDARVLEDQRDVVEVGERLRPAAAAPAGAVKKSELDGQDGRRAPAGDQTQAHSAGVSAAATLQIIADRRLARPARCG